MQAFEEEGRAPTGRTPPSRELSEERQEEGLPTYLRRVGEAGPTHTASSTQRRHLRRTRKRTAMNRMSSLGPRCQRLKKLSGCACTRIDR